MRKLFFLILLICQYIFAGNSISADPRQSIALVFASGMAEIQSDPQKGGLAQLATLLKKTRTENDHVLFLHGGGALSPSILSSTDKGAHMIALLNTLAPDGMALAKSEFAHKEDELTLRSFEAAFPLINSNLNDPLSGANIEGIYPYRIIAAGNFTIGIMSLIDPEVITDYMPKRISLEDTAATLLKTTAALRAEGADLIVLMADFPVPEIDRLLAGRIVDIALISDPSLDPPPEQTKHNYYELHGQTGVACLYSLALERHGTTISWTGKATTLALHDFEEDAAMKGRIEDNLAELTKILTTTVGITRTSLDTSRNAVRTGENSFGNLLADILREFYNSDFALVNGGGIRGNRQYSAGTVLTRGDIHRELPFNNRTINIKITGQQLLDSLENGLGRVEDGKGRFPHVSGMRIQYNPYNMPGRRVVEVLTPQGPLQADRKYTLATLDYIASGGDGYTIFKDCERIARVGGGRPFWEYIRDGIMARGEISPQIDGRLLAVTSR